VILHRLPKDLGCTQLNQLTNTRFMKTNKPIIFAAIFVMAFMFLAGEASAQQTTTRFNAKLLKQARVTPDDARQTALAAVPGNVEEEELEKEHGKLVFSYDIRTAKGTITEVQVDAKTGKIVSTEEESKADEEKERRRDQKKTGDHKPDGKG